MSASALLDKAMRLAGKRAAKTAFAFFTKEGQYIRIAHSQLKPHLKENGRWAKPALSALDIARLRKKAREAGVEFPLDKEWKNPPVVYKGQKHMLKRQSKIETIEKNLQEMPDKIEEYYKTQRARRRHLLDPIYLLNYGFAKRIK